MPATEEEILAAFESLNISINDRILARCVELCAIYKFDAENFVDEWFAYTASNLNGAPPTLDNLNQMERKEFSKKARNTTREVIDTTPVRPNSYVVEREEVEVTHNDTQTPQYMGISNTPSQKFSQRLNSRSIQSEFGSSPNGFQRQHSDLFAVKVLNGDIAKCRYMHQTCLSKREAINAMTLYVTKDIADYNKVDLSEESMQHYSGDMVICGRVYGANTGRLQSQTIRLEGTIDINKGQTIKLGVGNVDKFYLFNGQSVVVQGNNVRNYFIAQEIFTRAPLPPPENPISITQSIQIVAATGPFTLPDNLLYEPLEELLKYVIEFKPNILILMGPFIQRGEPNIKQLNESCDTFFEKIIDGIMERLKGTQVQVILAPSHRDFHNHVIFPSPPYLIRKHYDNLVLVPDPWMLDIDGLILGGSSADVLFHLSKNEFHNDKSQIVSDKFSRLISHVLNQRSFYPIYPPEADIRVDYCLLERFGTLDYLPHLLILPSIFHHFVKVVGDCVVVNPERISKGHTAGTFAKIEVRPPGGEPISKRVACQILRL